MVISEEQQAAFETETTCHICLKGFDLEEEDKVRDHCHWTGQYLGASHNKCNLAARRVKYVPIYAHNFSGYDSHFIMQALVKSRFRRKNISGLGYNGEKMRTIQFQCFRFQDSMQFINSSLESVVSELARSGHSFPILKKMGMFETDEQRSLLTRKGVFPYELLTSVKLFEDMTQFPKREDFYSSLTQSMPSEEDYNHGLRVFQTFKCKSNCLPNLIVLFSFPPNRNRSMATHKFNHCPMIVLSGSKRRKKSKTS